MAASVTLKVNGGGKLAKFLERTARKLGAGATVRVGFLEGATYPAIAAKELKKMPRNKATAARRKKLQKVVAAGGSLSVAQVAFWNNYGTKRAPARPFFSNMIAEDSPTWGRKLAKIAKATDMDSARTLALMGEYINDKLVTTIQRWPSDNAPYTAEKKGFNKGLIDTAVMSRSTSYEVVSR